MYESLKKHCPSFHLYLFAFDQRCCEILKKMNLDSVTVISLSEFESPELLRVKPSRSAGEYCWTCTSSTIEYSIENFKLDHCTYVDADLYFYSNPGVLIDEIAENSILLTEHKYSKAYECSINAGIFCVQFMVFKNDEIGMKALKWWKNACIDWCFARVEDGKFGDQKYLDDWPQRFAGVHVMKNPGGAIAPWNIQNCDLTDPSFKLIFYHFHDLKFFTNGKIELGRYKLRKHEIANLYIPYIRHLEAIANRVKMLNQGYDFHGATQQPSGLLIFYRNLKRLIEGSYNIYRKETLLGR